MIFAILVGLVATSVDAGRSTSVNQHEVYQQHLKYIKLHNIQPTVANSADIFSNTGSFVNSVYNSTNCVKGTEISVSGYPYGACMKYSYDNSPGSSYKYTDCTGDSVTMTSCATDDCVTDCDVYVIPLEVQCDDTMTTWTCTSDPEPWTDYKQFNFHQQQYWGYESCAGVFNSWSAWTVPEADCVSTVCDTHPDDFTKFSTQDFCDAGNTK